MVRFPALSILLKNLGKAHFYAKTAMYFGTHSFFFRIKNVLFETFSNTHGLQKRA